MRAVFSVRTDHIPPDMLTVEDEDRLYAALYRAVNRTLQTRVLTIGANYYCEDANCTGEHKAPGE